MDTDIIKINGQLLTPEVIQLILQKEKLQNWERSIYEFILNWFDPSDFIFQKTSGSTGTPKEIKLKKSAMKASAQKTFQFFGLQGNDTAWLCLPIEYIAGKMMVVRAIIGSLNLIITKPEGMPQIPNEQIDFAAMVPYQVQKLINSGTDFSNVKKLIIGGAAINPRLHAHIQHLPTVVYASYGMAETCSHIALQRINGEKPEKSFKTLPGIRVETDEMNRLIVQAPELSEQAITTNDYAELISEGEFTWKGRADNIINSGGLKIYPEEVEKKISDLIHHPFVIVPFPDQHLGQKAVLIIEGSPKGIQPEQLLPLLKKKLGAYLCPKEILFINNFPRNANMKIERQRIIQNFCK